MNLQECAMLDPKCKVTWEYEVADMICERATKSATSREDRKQVPLLVAVVGPPGSGKSTSSQTLTSLLSSRNALDKHPSMDAMIVPMDGYHYPLSTLKIMDNSKDLIYRRGAPDTFDTKALKEDLKQIKETEHGIIKIPGFDHKVGDPRPDLHVFQRNKHSVVICEGLYLLHDSDKWENTMDIFDLTIFIKSDINACIERLKIRNKCIPGYTEQEILVRCEAVDRVNANIVLESCDKADVVVESVID